MNTNILPEVGAEIRVQVRNPFAARQIPPQPEITEYSGRVLDPYRWLTDREFCMTGDAAWPTRVMNLGLIEDIEFINGTGTTIDTAAQSWQVAGSRGSTYTVNRIRSGWTCTCAGFQFRKSCRHISELRDSAK
jgi:hypothetical protein